MIKPVDNYGKFVGVMVTNPDKFTNERGADVIGFRIKVNNGSPSGMTVHCVDYTGKFEQARFGDTVIVEGAVTLKKREKNDKIYYNLYMIIND